MTQPASVRPISSAPSAIAQRAKALPRDHIVQFYESDVFLADAVADFLAAGLAAGESVIVIATAEHRDAFVARLRARAVDVDAARRRGRLTLLDACEVLAKIMDGAMPDAERFHRIIGTMFDSAAGGGRHPRRRLRAYGEMVDVLWKDAKVDGALRLEALWNELASSRSFSLLCAYALGNFYHESDDRPFQDVCRQHSHVVPTEQYIRTSDAERLLEISVLQRRARALDSEIVHRKTLERRLRDALAAQHDAEEALRGLLAREDATRAEAAVVDASDDGAAILVDANETRQILFDLLSNAITGTPVGGHVDLRVRECADDPGMVSIRVSSTGDGAGSTFTLRLPRAT